MTAKINDMVGTEAGFADDAAVNVHIAALGWIPVRGWCYYDNVLGVIKTWDGATWATGGSVDPSIFLLTAGTNGGATVASQVFTSGVTAGTVVESTAGAGVNVVGSRIFVPGAANPAPGTAAVDGDTYWNTALHMEMRYDATRSKWLSVDTALMFYSKSGNTAAGIYYNEGNLVMSSVKGWCVSHNATIVAMGYTRTNTNATEFAAYVGGGSVARLASSSTSGHTWVLNADVATGVSLAVNNWYLGLLTTDVFGWIRLKWRV